jgi:hypothetical protein
MLLNRNKLHVMQLLGHRNIENTHAPVTITEARSSENAVATYYRVAGLPSFSVAGLRN